MVTDMGGRAEGNRHVTRSEAMGMFGRMRSSTEEEQEAYRRMLDGMGTSLDINIHDLPDDGTPVSLGINVFDILDEGSE